MGSSQVGTSGCERDFDEVQRRDMESFAAFDADDFRAVHHPEVVSIFPSGARRVGIDAVMDALAPHFRERNATWRWNELHRFVDGCRSAFILYETWYEIPSTGFSQHALTAVTYVRERGTWLAIADQGTALP